MKYILRSINDWTDRWTDEAGQVFYFVALGDFWPKEKHFNRRLIRETTKDRKKAHEFESVEAAREILVLSGATNWSIVDSDGVVIE